MPYYERKITSGPIVEVERYFASRGGKVPRRAKREKPTPDEKKRLNERNAHKQLSRLIFANFTERDLFVTWTWRTEPEPNEARKAIQKAIRKLRGWCRENGHPPLKYISVTETGKRAHHHLILPEYCLTAAMELWQHGMTLVSPLILYDGGGYALSHYIRKESDGDEAQGKPAFSKRWNASKNLIQPKQTAPVEIGRINPTRQPKEVIGIEKGAKKYTGLRLLDWASGSGVFGDWQYVRMMREDKPPPKNKRRPADNEQDLPCRKDNRRFGLPP